ncbi:MAG: hypothetical protein KAR08_11915 [Candidatus Heimdallarchaeota archaeon]|nr:hypothetical protein [Candidatus Heimdallarchaeota archaeon]
MNETVSIDSTVKRPSRRFVTLDIARGIAILLMLILHIVKHILDTDTLMSDANIVTEPVIALSALIIIPFFGGLAGFFLIASAASNMVSMYRDLEKGKSVRSLIVKQVISGFVLLIFAMICEGFTGYWGALGDFFLNLNNPAATNWAIALWRWNHFETIHAIAWCIIVNGIIHGLLSMKGRWKNRRNLIKSYIIMAFVVVALTLPIWLLVDVMVPGYPFTVLEPKILISTPRIGFESFWEIIRAPFLNVLASPIEPLFPYLAVSFIGSIIGIIISQPKEQIDINFPRKLFLIGLSMFLTGLITVVVVIGNVAVNTGFLVTGDIEPIIDFYFSIVNHGQWTPYYASYIPQFSWLAQFLAVNGFSLILYSILFRLIEFRGASKQFANRSKFIRRFGTIAFTNYNNQWYFFIVWAFTSFILKGTAYAKLQWGGTALVILLTLGFYSLINWLWEKIGYIGSMEWFIRTLTNNLVPVRRSRFGPEVKWWQKGQVDAETQFYNAEWIDIVERPEIKPETKEEIVKSRTELRESKLSLTLSLVGLLSIFFFITSIFGLLIAINSRKREGKNNYNKAGLIISIIALVVIVGVFVALSNIKIGVLGLF